MAAGWHTQPRQALLSTESTITDSHGKEQIYPLQSHGAQLHFPRATSTCLLRGQRAGNTVGHCSWAGSCPKALGDTAQGQQSNVQIPSYCFRAVGVSFLNSKTGTNKKLRDTIASDNDIPLVCSIFFCCFGVCLVFNEGKCTSCFWLYVKRLP